MKLDDNLIKKIEDILARGNTAEVKLRKDDIIVLEAERKIKYSQPLKR